MHDQVTVRVLDRRANAYEQLETLAHEQGAAVAVVVDGLAIDMLHHQVRRSVVELPAVDQTRDGGMGECGEDVPLAVQPAAQAGMQGGVVQYLDGHRLLVLGIVALAAIDGAHAAMAEDGDDAIVADARTHQTVLMFYQQRFRRLADDVHQRVLGALVRCQQRLDRTQELSVASAGACQTRGLLSGRRINHLVEQ